MTVEALRDRVHNRLFALVVAGSPAVKPKPRALKPRSRDDGRLDRLWADRVETVKGGQHVS